MKHLETYRVIDLVRGRGNTEERAHLAGCALCSGRLELWRSRLADLRQLEACALEASEVHNLRALYRELGPPQTTLRRWVAKLVHSSEPAPAAVRGGLAATLDGYEAGPYQIVVQVRPSDIAGRYDLQGQVTGDRNDAGTSTRVVLTSDEGYADSAQVDRFGEFRMVGVPAGPYRIVWFGGGERIELERLEVGEREGDGGG
jgi:hypothetical protein